MISLNLPSFEYKVKQTDGKLYIFDILRKKYIFLTPEEWVRQHLVHFLIHSHHYPNAFIKLESSLHYNQLKKRADALVFDSEGKPFLLIECKGANIEITQDVLEQAASYNYIIKAPYLLITNGLEWHCCKTENQSSVWLSEIPVWQ
jgi:hypothetical protein